MMTARMTRSRQCAVNGSGRRGVATVELAMLLPTLVLLLFGTLELGFMAKQVHSLNHIAREAARIASTGATTSRIQAHMVDVAPAMDPEQVEATVQYRGWDEQTGTWGSWVTLVDDGAENAAASGDQIRVGLRYSYELATGGLLAGLLGASEDNTMTIDAAIVSMRE